MRRLFVYKVPFEDVWDFATQCSRDCGLPTLTVTIEHDEHGSDSARVHCQFVLADPFVRTRWWYHTARVVNGHTRFPSHARRLAGRPCGGVLFTPRRPLHDGLRSVPQFGVYNSGPSGQQSGVATPVPHMTEAILVCSKCSHSLYSRN
jgi:hypothetical protein